MNFKKEQLIENAVVRLAKEIRNAAGFQIDIDTLTGIKARVTEQKLPAYAPSDYMPVVVGENAWMETSLTYKTFDVANSFEAGIIDTGSNYGRMEKVDTQVEGVLTPRKVWANTIEYNLANLQQAQVSGNWSLVEKLESARYRRWMLGIQETAFLGLDAGDMNGLLSLSGVTSNTTVITKSIKTMNATEFQALLAGLMPAYATNANNTALPDTFVIPANDFNGLAVATDETYGQVSKLQRLQEAFVAITGNPQFKILPLPYAESGRSGLGVERYILYRRTDADTLSFEIPVDYTTTITDTVNGFNYSSVAYGQFSSVAAFRPQEILYFDY